MWNSKRVLLLGVGFAVFLAGYIVYATFLGGIDGYPPLPEILKPGKGPELAALPPPNESEVDRKLKKVFGDTCIDVNRTIKLEIRKKRMVLASNEFQIVDEGNVKGRVKLTPFRLGLFSEDKGDHKYPEINSIQSDVALLTFDQPIVSMTDIGNRKIVAAELKGNIIIINNRRTSQKTDDIEIRVDQKPLYFDERLNKIWTDGYVQLLDLQTSPHPTKILGKGLELFLAREDQQPTTKTADAKKAKPKPKGDAAVSGVDHVVLLTNVEMHLYPDDSNSGFPSSKDTSKPGGKAKAADPKGEKKQSKSHVVIRTQGPFQYDVPKDVAVFESPLPGVGAHEQVHVLREILRDKDDKTAKTEKGSKDGELDQMLCDRLVLQFRRKAGAGAEPSGARDTRGSDREIESAHATCRPGGEVWLVMDSESLAAQCAELIYHCPTATRGPQTVLKGDPMQAVKEGHKIQARELTLTGASEKDKGRPDSGQQLEARGPGQVDLFDRTNAARPHPTHAFWQDMLVSAKTKEGDRVLDLLTFTGDAFFLDEEHDQELHGEKLMVWLEPNDTPPPAAQPKAPPDGAQGNAHQRLSRVEAFERVRARSPDMRIKECEHLTLLFKDGVAPLPDNVAAAPKTPPPPAHTAERPAGSAPPARAASEAISLPAPTATQAAAPKQPEPKTAEAKPGEGEKAPKKPIELWGRDVTAYVTRLGPKNDLREMVAEGTVHVHQDGSKPEDKGVDIKGEMLRLQHHVSGDILDVYAGDPKEPAELQLGDLFLKGPKVRIDQQKNIAWVVGIGVMTMPSNTTFDGGKPTRPGTTLTVHWTRDMLFNGKEADFHGGVIAYQDNASLKGQLLHVTLDKTVSFKEGQKGGQGAKVERVVSHGKVYVVDSKYDEKTGKPVQYQRLLSHQIVTNNPDGRLMAPGPGRLYMWQPGSADEDPSAPPGGKPAQAPPRPQEPVMYLTRVDFQDQMNSIEQKIGPGEQDKRRTSKFYGNVEVVRVPADTPDVEVDIEKLPKGGMYMRSELLTVISRPLPGTKKNTQEMYAEKRVFFRTPEFFGNADIVTYDESKDQVVFKGVAGNKATLYRRKAGVQGQEYEEIKGRTILYNRKTGQFILDGGEVINISRLEIGPPQGVGAKIASVRAGDRAPRRRAA